MTSNASVRLDAARHMPSSGLRYTSVKLARSLACCAMHSRLSWLRALRLLRNNGCYAQTGPVGFTTRRLDRGATKSAPTLTAKQEARAIDCAFSGRDVPQDGVRGGRDLRLHTAGDASTPAAASILGAAAKRWKARKGGDVWTYTHAGKAVPRSAWGAAVSVLASVDRIEDVPAVRAQGYAVARYVASFPSTRAWDESGMRWIPCPAQTRDNVGCADCRLCMDSEGLRARNTGIVFAAHGNQANKIKRRLTVVAA